MIFVGADGGGTKTEMLAADETGHIFSRLITSGCNYYSVRLSGIRKVLTEATQALLLPHCMEASDIAMAAIGMPVVEENPTVEQEVSAFLGQLYPRHLLYNDAMVALAGSLGGKNGVNVICGTGSICSGFDGITYVRCGGWSGQFCDEASCHWLGRKTLELFTKQADGRMPKSAVYTLLREHFSLSRDLDLTYIINHELNQNRDRMADVQRVLASALAAGDDNAKALYRQAAGEICLMVQTVHRGLGLAGKVPVSYSGGLFRVTALLDMVKAGLGSQYTFQAPQYSPAQGALILAAKNCLPPEAMPTFLSNLKDVP